MRAVINIHGTRDLHNKRSAARRHAALRDVAALRDAAQRCATPRSAARHFAALIALVSNFIRDAAQRCFLCECCR